MLRVFDKCIFPSLQHPERASMLTLIAVRDPVWMSFKLGKQHMRPVNDGSLAISYTDTQTRGWKEKIPVLSVEVSTLVL
jgi:hypothetical protein